jgi:hypothetical protein
VIDALEAGRCARCRRDLTETEIDEAIERGNGGDDWTCHDCGYLARAARERLAYEQAMKEGTPT